MAPELIAGASQLGFIPVDAQRSEQLCSGIAGELFQVRDAGLRCARDPRYQRPAAAW